jgi:pseudouridylate synthase
MTPGLTLSDEVAAALADGRPVVALETTLVSHGFSAGRGLAAALDSEDRVRAAGAVPATIGVLDGEIKVGLAGSEIERFAAAGTAARKVGPRDLAACVVQGVIGSTTVGGTLAVCKTAGIAVMATGGIGGVHRGFAKTLDISADVLQIAATPAVVVCSGAKAILDVPATAELLETTSVPVLGYRTTTLPLFYSALGGPPVSATVSSAAEAARIARTHWATVNRDGGLILARPPDDGLDLENLIARALSDVEARGVTGQAVTPAVLARIEELSDGRSVAVNQALIAGNADLAGQVATVLAGTA